jgi:beta-galactosidase
VPHPGLLELKKVYQYITVTPVDLARGEIEVNNGLAFIGLDGFEGFWEIQGDGEGVASGRIPSLKAAPFESQKVWLPLPAIDPRPGVEYWLDLSFRLAEDTPWAERGHEVAWEQFKLDLSTEALPLHPAAMSPLEVAGDEGHVIVSGDGFAVQFDLAAGTMESLTVGGIEMIRSGPRPNFWRAPTDNDRGNDMPERCAPWKVAGENWQVHVHSVEQPEAAKVEVSFEGPLPDVDGNQKVQYTVLGSGEIIVESSVSPGDVELPEIPRFGMQLVVPGGFETVTWYGRGPHESYWDRKAGARVGLWSGTVDEQFVDYSEPQENGNKTDVRWVSLTNDEGTGLLVVGEPLIGFSVHHYTTNDLETAKHSYQMAYRQDITFNVDLEQTGVGGDDSWGARTHDQYTLWPEPMSYRFRLRPMTRAGAPAKELARQGR